ncbi:MAG: putative ATPase [Acidimicrobiales bacterium]|jgi:predicted ATPase
MPLAVELAASRNRALTLAEIDANLEDRLRLLRQRRRGVAARQSSLEATIQWSHDLLDDDERALFDRLSVLVGSFDLDAAWAIAGENRDQDRFDILELVDSLV